MQIISYHSIEEWTCQDVLTSRVAIGCGAFSSRPPPVFLLARFLHVNYISTLFEDNTFFERRWLFL